MTTSAASKLFTQALKKIESDSIRTWARRQRPQWVKIIKTLNYEHGDYSEVNAPTKLATHITLTAMG